MATTTNYSWTTPDDTDLVKDGAAAIRTLGSAIDTTVFNNAGAAVAKSTVDAKGDLIVGTADNTVGRLAVGTNGYTLVADSSVSPTGLKWAAPAGAAGLTLITTQTFTTSGAVNVNDIFSATYEYYKLVLSITASTSSAINVRLRVSGADNSTSNYQTQRLTASGATVSAAQVTAATSSEITDYTGSEEFIVDGMIYNPFETKRTNMVFQSSVEIPVNYWVRAGLFDLTTSFTGLSILPVAGTITGTVSVWGYSK